MQHQFQKDHNNEFEQNEASEHSFVSIAKGVQHATHNARVAVLAAANQFAGQYEKDRSMKYNTRLNDALMSRFDIFSWSKTRPTPRTTVSLSTSSLSTSSCSRRCTGPSPAPT